MTDLISSLADAIIALINAKPASPTKEEVASVVHSQLADAVLGIGSYPFVKPAETRADEVQRERVFLTRSISRQRAPSVGEIAAENARKREELRIRAEANPDIFDHEKVRAYLADCQGEAPPPKSAMQQLVEDHLAKHGAKLHVPCPRHLDGIHTFDRPQHAYATPCPCGAHKP
jgi:hypothetical protein